MEADENKTLLTYTGSAEGEVTFLGKYPASAGSRDVLVDNADLDLLLQTGFFQVKEDTGEKKTSRRNSSKTDSDQDQALAPSGLTE